MQFLLEKNNLTQISSKKHWFNSSAEQGAIFFSLATSWLSLRSPSSFQTIPRRWAVSPWRWKSWMWMTMRRSLQGSTNLSFAKTPKQDRWEMLVMTGAGRGQGWPAWRKHNKQARHGKQGTANQMVHLSSLQPLRVLLSKGKHITSPWASYKAPLFHPR